MKADSPNVFNYEEPQEFIRDYIDFKKKRRSSFSLREFSTRVGFRSSGALSMVLSGKRQLSLDSASRIAEAVQMKWKEKQYFFLLVRRSQAKDPTQKNQLRELILKTKFRTTKNFLGSKQYRFLSEWYYPVLYLLVGNQADKRRVDQFAALLGRGISKDQVTQALHDMKDLGLLDFKNGTYLQRHAHLTTEDDIQEPATFQYLSKMMELAKEALELPAEKREFGSITLEIPPEEWPWLKERIREFRQEITDRLGENKQSLNIYQVNIQAFPLTKETDE